MNLDPNRIRTQQTITRNEGIDEHIDDVCFMLVYDGFREYRWGVDAVAFPIRGAIWTSMYLQ